MQNIAVGFAILRYRKVFYCEHMFVKYHIVVSLFENSSLLIKKTLNPKFTIFDCFCNRGGFIYYKIS